MARKVVLDVQRSVIEGQFPATFHDLANGQLTGLVVLTQLRKTGAGGNHLGECGRRAAGRTD